ncbi:hypothetical protein DRN62_00605 [Nanoarchaeota archaeon]|nr:MAG: hypothetical protein DRN62_00605 [Nanoarchaeota archaeon]
MTYKRKAKEMKGLVENKLKELGFKGKVKEINGEVSFGWQVYNVKVGKQESVFVVYGGEDLGALKIGETLDRLFTEQGMDRKKVIDKPQQRAMIGLGLLIKKYEVKEMDLGELRKYYGGDFLARSLKKKGVNKVYMIDVS